MRIVRIAAGAHAEIPGEFAHGGVFGKVDGIELFDAVDAAVWINWRMSAAPNPLSCQSSATVTAISRTSDREFGA